MADIKPEDPKGLIGQLARSGRMRIAAALVVVALHGHASVSEAVAFSLGLQATVMATNILVAGGVGAVAVQRIGTRGVRALLPWPRRYQSVGL